jgi:hypothetical protein
MTRQDTLIQCILNFKPEEDWSEKDENQMSETIRAYCYSPYKLYFLIP